MLNFSNFLVELLSSVINQLYSSPVSSVVAGTVLELGVYSLPEFFSDPSSSVPVTTSSSFNKIIKSDEDTVTKAALVTGHSVKIGLILVIGLSILTVTVNLVNGPAN